MILFDSLHLENFGPYINETVKFDKNKGILVVHAQNGVGKTTLFEAFEWVLLEKLSLKGERANRSFPEDWMNTITLDKCRKEKEDFSMKVTLNLSSEGNDYQIRREARKPKGTGDIETLLVVKENGNILSQNEAKKVMEDVLPDSLGLLMFVDGERMDELQKAVQQREGQALLPILKKIEESLGITLLENLATEVNKVYTKASQELTRQDGLDANHKEILNNLAAVNLEIERLDGEILATQTTYELANEAIGRIEGDFRDSEKSREIIDKKNLWQGKLEERENSTKSSKEVLNLAAKESWKFLINEEIVLRIKKLTDDEKKVDKKLQKLQQKDHLQHLREESFASGKCSVCGSSYTKDPGDEESSNHADLKENLNSIRDELKVLTKPATARAHESLTKNFRIYLERETDLLEARDIVADCEGQLLPVNQEGMLRLAQDYENQTAIRNQASATLRNLNASRNNAVDSRTTLQRDVEKYTADEDNDRWNKIQMLSAQLRDFFTESAAKLRKDKRSQVEEYATELFAGITEENEYKTFAGIKLNDQYGVSVVDDKGEEIGGLGAGHDLISLLSLLGGLQKAAVMQTPIVFDSALAKLDSANAAGLLRYLPMLVYQSIIFVHDNEATPENVSREVADELIIEQIRAVPVDEDRLDVRLVPA